MLQSRIREQHTAPPAARTQARKISRAGKRPPLDTSLVQEDKRLWEETVNDGPKWTKFARLPFGLLRVLDLEEAAFLIFLVQWSWWKVGEAVLARNQCWFYCPEKAMDREIPRLTQKVRRRLFANLKQYGFLTMDLRTGKRLLRIQFAAIAQAVRAP